MKKHFGYNEDPDDEKVYITAGPEELTILLPRAAADAPKSTAPLHAKLATAAVTMMSIEKGQKIMLDFLRQIDAEIKARKDKGG